MNEVQNMDEPHRNLLNIWVFDRGNLLCFGEKGIKNYGTKVIDPYDMCITFPYDAECANGN
jgi:hypothetical protein